MRLIKRLDIFILKNYLTLFAGTFCISLFVVMMQFLWKYIDELVGKGLTFDVYAKFFFYAGETLVPLALPLAILLASLISFGNIGERLELLAIKAAGISLFRTLRPLIILNLIMAAISFHFQNKIVPDAQTSLKQLLVSMKMKSPELDIPEGVFYDGIDNINLFVRKKNPDTGMLYDVIIYNLRDGVSKAHIILADSAKMESTDDKLYLLIHIYSGEQFENLSGGSQLKMSNVPYRRETFVEKHVVIAFDANFNMTDQESVSGSAMTKNLSQLAHDIDSMKVYYDSLSVVYRRDMRHTALAVPHAARISDYDSAVVAGMPDRERKSLENEERKYQKRKAARENAVPASDLDLDSLFRASTPQQRQQIVMEALQKANYQNMDISYKAEVMEYGDKTIRRHWVEYWHKFTMSLACLLFFFIGAPLGAIIRKGGLGFPVVVAVIIFLVYYITDTFGMKVSREGGMPVWLGMWLSTLVLAPLGVFFTIKSNNDSTVFNADAYIIAWKRLTGIRSKRNIFRKEVIINDPDYAAVAEWLEDLAASSRGYLGTLRHPSFIGYLLFIARCWFSKRRDTEAERISAEVERVVEVLSNSKDRYVLQLVNGYPVMDPSSFRFYRRRRKDLRAVIKYSEKIKDHIHANIL